MDWIIGCLFEFDGTRLVFGYAWGWDFVGDGRSGHYDYARTNRLDYGALPNGRVTNAMLVDSTRRAWVADTWNNGRRSPYPNRQYVGNG